MSDAIPATLQDAMAHGLAPLLVPVYADIAAEATAGGTGAGWLSYCRTLTAFARSGLAEIARLGDVAAMFQTRYAHVEDGAEQRAAVLDFAARLGAGTARLRRDRKAFERWFDADAVRERYRRRVGQRERAVAHAVERAGLMAAEAVRAGECRIDDPVFGREFAVMLDEVRRYRGEQRVREAAHLALLHVARAAGATGDVFWIEQALRETRRAALDWRESVWGQCAALETLALLSPAGFRAVASERLSADRAAVMPQRRDAGLFVGRHLARLVAGRVGRDGRLRDLLERLSLDPEGCIRQALAEAIPSLPSDIGRAMATRMRIDVDPQVRAALFAAPAAMAEAIGVEEYAAHLVRILSRENDEFVLRLAIDAAAVLAEHLRARGAEDALVRHAPALRRALIGVRDRVERPRQRRWAGEAFERIWLAGDREALALAKVLHDSAATLKEGGGRRLPALAGEIPANPDKVGRIMAVLAQANFGYDLTEGPRPLLTRGDRLRRRLWRTLFEARHKATDKRQAFLHTIGRSYAGTLCAPSARMAELAPTKVPGEPLFQSDDGNWRNWLPLVDHALSAIDLGKPIRLFTSEGITTITPPPGFAARARSYWRLSREFAAVAELRNRAGHDYARVLARHGVTLEFAPHPPAAPAGEDGGVPPDPSVVRFFSLAGPFAALPLIWDQVVSYAATVFANTLGQLALFLGLVCLWFFGRHIILGQHARRVRSGIALSLGGWGTRGKSGTERLKAGLINALGPPLVSKTTGCEAMFLNGEAFGELTEMFLFRPYDKATIWEQYNLIKLARRLGGRVFLWECMGLNPSYVRVLQRDWMRDDIGTLTNTYPDHEDVQGPAGRDIPVVMTQFIPERSICLTTEEEMLPILQQGAEAVGTRLRTVGWRQAGLIHKSLLARFPYEEHPYNIALVTAMGDELGLAPDFCIKEMSDRVVADLGVLKTYPRSRIDGRTLEYVMGNSANERFGAMGNWVRMGFEDHSLSRDPEIFVTTVVNNRADRVPRSRVFARILVTDIAADRHFLIGSNIDGLIGFIDEEWGEYERSLSLAQEGAAPLDLLETWARRQRIALTAAELAGVLRAMLSAGKAPPTREEVEQAIAAQAVPQLCARHAPDFAEAVAAHYRELEGFHARYEKLRQTISSALEPASHDAEVRSLLRDAFMTKIVPIRDYYIEGEQIVRLIAKATPPGLINRIMGMQNIKGTGLDFVYRWQAWEAVSKACDQALDADEAIAAKGIGVLAGFQEYGRLSEARVKAAVSTLRARAELPTGIGPAQLDAIVARLDEQIAAVEDARLGPGAADAGGKRLSERFATYAVSLLEGVLDGGDAVRRRRKADRIYEALVAEQISNPRAAVELKKLTSRQKGGWLATTLTNGADWFAPRRWLQKR